MLKIADFGLLWCMFDRPTLYHGTSNQLVGEELLPHPTGRLWMCKPTLSATESFATAAVYSFMPKEVKELGASIPDHVGTFSGFYKVVRQPETGQERVALFVRPKHAFLRWASQHTGTVYAMPQEHLFYKPHGPARPPIGQELGEKEWVTETPVSTHQCGKMEVGLKDLMLSGVDIYFLRPGCSIDDEAGLYEELHGQPLLHQDNPAKLIQALVSTKDLEHYNRTCGLASAPSGKSSSHAR